MPGASERLTQPGAFGQLEHAGRERIDVAHIICDRLQAKLLVLTTGSGDALEENNTGVLMSCLMELADQAIQLSTVLSHKGESA